VREFARDLRVADFVRDELANIIVRKVRDPRVGMISINDVKVSKDLSFADVYVSSVDISGEDQKQELVDVLNKAAGFFRTELSGRHKMRTTPKPRFHYDELAESGPRLEALIDKAVASDHRSDPQED
jgi:ribosome-binding factor A